MATRTIYGQVESNGNVMAGARFFFIDDEITICS